MPNGKLAVFIAKRVLICYVLLTIIDIVLVKQRWFALFGLTAGGVFSVLKFGSYAWMLERIVSGSSAGAGQAAGAAKGILVFAVNQLLIIPLLFLAYYCDQWFFTGFVAGILLVPFVIMINCLTETVGITHNNFE